MFCSHVDTACTCESVCHTCVRGHVIDRSVCGYVFFVYFVLEFVFAVCPPSVCPAMCSPRARGMLVLCSPCAHRGIVVGSPFTRVCRVITVGSLCVRCARRGLVLVVYSPCARRGFVVWSLCTHNN